MMEGEIQTQLGDVQEAQIVVGIPSYNNVRTIGHVVRAVIAGLAKYFPNSTAVLVNSDGGSTDGTQEEVKRVQIEDYKMILTSYPVHPVHRVVTPYYGVPGKGSAFRTIFEAAKRLKAKACAVVDSDLRSITPEWMELLLRPVYEGGYDYVAPLYNRHKFDGTITNSIVYPLTRALYGRVRQPSGDSASRNWPLYRPKVWEAMAQFGIDIWIATSPLPKNLVCQSFLRENPWPKIREAMRAHVHPGRLFVYNDGDYQDGKGNLPASLSSDSVDVSLGRAVNIRG
jgi:glycosyltransferase involved in cell wall biosynthesis